MPRPYLIPALALVLAASLLAGCSAGNSSAETKAVKPANTGGPETLAAAPAGLVEDTPSWTELPKPVADAFGAAPAKSKFQAYAAMKTATVQAQLAATPDPKTLFKVLSEASAFVPSDYTILLHLYAPGTDGKLKYSGYEWGQLAGTLVLKTSTDADQGWDAAITAVTAGSATQMSPETVKKVASGELQPPLFTP